MPVERKPKREYDLFDTYVRKLTEDGINDELVQTLNNITHALGKELAIKSRLVADSSDKKTVTPDEISGAVKLCLSGYLRKSAHKNGIDAVNLYKHNKKFETQGRQTGATQSGLVFPPARIRRLFLEKNACGRVSETASVYLAAVLQYVCEEMLETSNKVKKDNSKRKRINVRDLRIAVETDRDLLELVKNMNIHFDGGVLPKNATI